MGDVESGAAAWPHGDGEMPARVRAHDWGDTPLGPIERWPGALRTAVEMMLAMPGPATILWGPHHVQIYNDAYVAIARDRHPALLGRPVATGWPDAYEAVIAPLLGSVAAGQARRLVAYPVRLLAPDGTRQERLFDTDWSPIRDETGAVAGALQTLTEATERLRLDAALRESEARHRLLIGSWAQAVWETDGDGVVVTDSPSWRAYTGQTLEAWLGDGWLDAIHPDDRAYAERQWREAIGARGLVEAEFRLRAPDGGWRWTNVRAAPVLDSAGRIEKWAGINIDIDARKRAETALRASEAKFRALFESMDEAYAVVDVLRDARGAWADFRFVEVNQAFLHHTGMPWPVGQTATELLGSPNPRWSALYGEALDAGRSIRVEMDEPTLGRTFDLNIFALDRALDRVAVLFTDVTERRRAEVALRESEEIRRLALDSGRMGAWTWDTRAGTVRTDAAVQALWGMTAAEQPHPVSLYADLMYADGAVWLASVAAQQIAPGEDLQVQVQIADGPTRGRWVEVRGRAERDRPWIINGVSFDITEQRLAEQRLVESETLFRTLAEVIEDVFYVTDLDAGRLDYLSPAYEAIWGRPAAELLRDLESFAATIHPDDRAGLAASKAAQARGETVHAEYRITRPDGSVRWILDRCFPIPGGPRRLSVGVATDITPRREVEERVRASEERLRLLVDSVRDYAIFTVDSEGLITSWPAGAASVYGWSAAEALGRSADMTFLPEDVAAGVPHAEREAAARDGLAPNVRWHRRKDGAHRFIDGSTQPLRAADGEIREFIKIGQDVTERRRVQQALSASQERLRTLIEGIPQLVWRSADLGHWTWSSPQWQAFTGRSLKASRGHGWLEAVHADDRAAVLRAWDGAAAAGGLDVECRVRRDGDGAFLWHHTRAVPVRGEGGAVLEWLGTTTDVQQLKELQEHQTVLVAELQHRTRNLMGVVRYVADRTARSSTDLTDFGERFRDRLEALARVQGLLSRLADVDRVCFDELLRSELAAMSDDMRRVTLDGPPGVRLRSSTVQTFAMALHELATNAVKYGALGQPEGHLAVRWRLDPAGRGGRPWLHVTWQESGVTMPPAGASPRGGGQGRELIERALPYQLGAETHYAIGPDGICCTIALPVSALVEIR